MSEKRKFDISCDKPNKQIIKFPKYHIIPPPNGAALALSILAWGGGVESDGYL